MRPATELGVIASGLPHTLRWLVIVLASSFLVSCLEVHHTIEITERGSGVATIELLVEAQYAAMVIPQMESELSRDKDWKVVKRDEVEGKSRLVVQKAFDSVEQLSDETFRYSFEAVGAKSSDRKYRLQIEALKNWNEPVPFEVRARLPGVIHETNGERLSRDEVGWHFNLMKRGQVMTVVSVSSKFSLRGLRQSVDGVFDRLFGSDDSALETIDIGTLGGKRSSVAALSLDGTVVAGVSETATGAWHAFRWSNGVMTDLGTLGGAFVRVADMSADGRVVVGTSATRDGSTHAFRWVDGVMADLGTLGGDNSDAVALSADGSVVVGNSRTASGTNRAFRWENGLLADIGTLNSGSTEVYDVSADGSVAVGTTLAADQIRMRAFRWERGNMTDLGHLNPNRRYGTADAIAISSDGSTIIGSSAVAGDRQIAFRWRNGEMVALGTANQLMRAACGLSADGSVIVGSDLGGNAYRWTTGNLELLPSQAGRSTTACAVSADGTTIVGEVGEGVDKPRQVVRWRGNSRVVIGESTAIARYPPHFLSADGSIIAVSGLRTALLLRPAEVFGTSRANARNIFYAFIWVVVVGLLIGSGLVVRGRYRRFMAARATREPATHLGGSQQKFCSECGASVEASSRFCTTCGSKLAG